MKNLVIYDILLTYGFVNSNAEWNENMKHVFIVNPAAGRKDSTNEIREYLLSRGDIDWEIYNTTSRKDAIWYIRNWGAAHPGEKVRFYACGGDGTLNEVVCGAVGNPDASVAVYACGSGNDYVKYYGPEAEFRDLGALIDAEEVEVDLMKVGDRYSINVTNFGFDTKVVQTMVKLRRSKVFSGKRAYFAGIATALCRGMKNTCKVYIDGDEIELEKILLCTIANGRYVGGSFMCAPKSKNDDGLLEVCLVKPLSRVTFVSLIGDYTNGTHLDKEKFNKYITYRRAKKIEVEAPEGFAYLIDGEMVEKSKFTVEIKEKALRFAVPKTLLKKNEEASEAPEPALV